MIEKFLLAYKTFEISSDGMGPGYRADSFKLDGKAITGSGITSITYEGKSCERTRIIIEGNKDLMEPFVQARLAYYESGEKIGVYGDDESIGRIFN